jgi:acyl dehydratase
MEKRYFEDFVVGESIEFGSYTLTEEEIIAFAKQFDPQPFHVDPEKAAASFYGGLIASGWHTASTYMRLLVNGLLQDTQSLGSPGVDELRWLKPVRPGDTLQARYTVLETNASKSRPNVGIIRSNGEMVNQNGEVVMTIIAANFFARRPE